MKLDLGCGKRKKEGFIGVDVVKFDGVDIVLDIGKDPWPWKDKSVEEVRCSHTLEHLEVKERIHFVNELFRVLKDNGFATIVVPYWCSTRSYGDLTHKWPPVSDFWPLYLDKEWREHQAAHNDGYTCNFSHETKFVVSEYFLKNYPQYKENAWMFPNAIDDMIVVLKKKNGKKS